HFEIGCHRGQLRHCHEPPCGHHHHHEVHQPEVRRGSHFAGGEGHCNLACANFLASLAAPRLGQPVGRWRLQEHRRDDHHNALEKPPFDKGRLVSLAVDHVGDGCNCKCSPCAEP